MKVLVTGGGGFLGGAIVRMLRARGDEVTVVARGDYPELQAAGVRLHRGDLADAAAVDAAFVGQELVIHAAAKPGVWGPYEDYYRSNVLATRVVIAACRKYGISRLVYTSSPSVVFSAGDHEDAGNDLPYPDSYLAFYPQTKAEAEREVLAANSPSLATVSLRPHLIWGPGDPNLLPRLIDRARRGRLRIVGDGKNKVSLTYIDNAAAGHVQAADQLAPGVAWAGKAYFINDPEPVNLWDWINNLLLRLEVPQVKRKVSPGLARFVGGVAEWVWRSLSLAGEPPMTRFVAEQLCRSHWYSLAPAQAAFGYHPVRSAAEALELTAKALKKG
jgi:nucleoside-diphosphate-sugar epimerase